MAKQLVNPIERHVEKAVLGVAGISRDLREPGHGEGLAEMASAIARIRDNYSSELRVEQLARTAGLSLYQFNRRVRSIFGITRKHRSCWLGYRSLAVYRRSDLDFCQIHHHFTETS